MACELTVIVKNEEKRLATKFLIYDDITVDAEDPIIKASVEQTLKNFGDEPTDVQIKITMTI